ncbi:MAG TPA: hypothetical protein PKD61_01170 [Polyangiaceae bacterium]|nr:hypothetical protein [Polyangiaceae bacterium]
MGKSVTRLGAAALGGALACNTVLGIESLPRGSEGTGGGAGYASEACGSCIAAACNAERSACQFDAECSELAACLAQCLPSQPACRGACWNLHGTQLNRATSLDFDKCQRTHCLEACIGSGGYAKGLSAECGVCVDQQCAKLSRACAEQPICDRVYSCAARSFLSPGHGPGPLFGCFSVDVPVVSQATDDLEDCWHQCEQCPIGNDWRCVGQFEWGRPESSVKVIPNTFTVEEVDEKQLRDPAPGVTVEVCSGLLPSCAADPQVTDELGRVFLQLPNAKFGFEGHLRLTRSDLMSTLYFLGRPVVFPESQLGWLVFSPGLYKAAAAFEGAPVVPGMGHVSVVVWDCNVQEAPGISLSIDQAHEEPGVTKNVYLDGTTTSTGKSGAAAIANVIPGQVTVQARVEKTGQLVAEYEIEVVADTISGLSLFPLSAGELP